MKIIEYKVKSCDIQLTFVLTEMSVMILLLSHGLITEVTTKTKDSEPHR